MPVNTLKTLNIMDRIVKMTSTVVVSPGGDFITIARFIDKTIFYVSDLSENISIGYKSWHLR